MEIYILQQALTQLFQVVPFASFLPRGILLAQLNLPFFKG
jgi:hypothetical protein